MAHSTEHDEHATCTIGALLIPTDMLVNWWLILLANRKLGWNNPDVCGQRKSHMDNDDDVVVANNGLLKLEIDDDGIQLILVMNVSDREFFEPLLPIPP